MPRLGILPRPPFRALASEIFEKFERCSNLRDRASGLFVLLEIGSSALLFYEHAAGSASPRLNVGLTTYLYCFLSDNRRSFFEPRSTTIVTQVLPPEYCYHRIKPQQPNVSLFKRVVETPSNRAKLGSVALFVKEQHSPEDACFQAERF